MKAKLNLTIDQEVLLEAKRHAYHSKTSISKMVEGFLRKIAYPNQRKTVIEIVQELPEPKSSDERDLKKAYIEERAEKYGV